MKKIFRSFLLVLALIAGAQAVKAQHYYVRERPPEPVFVRPLPPSPRHVWVEGDWTWGGGRYVRQPGRWQLAPYHSRWIPGRWVREPGGLYWRPGHWRRR